MVRYLYTSDDKIYISGGNVSGADGVELVSERIVRCRESLKSIQNKKQWKNSGSGAIFTGVYENKINYDKEGINAYIAGVSRYKDDFVYSVSVNEVSGLYIKSINPEDNVESHIFASNNFVFGTPDVFGDRCAVSIGNAYERYLAVFELPSGNYTEFTDGDSREDFPSFSKDGKRIYFSTAGNARNQYGAFTSRSPFSAAVYDFKKNSIATLFESDKHDFLRIKEDNEGNLYFIRRPYYQNERGIGISFADIMFMPFRLVKAIFGFLNSFSVLFGGESLNSNNNPNNILKTKQRKESDIFIDGNIINAERNIKLGQRQNEKFPGLIPRSWELVRADKNGALTAVKRGVMDFTVCDSGDILYSNGYSLVRLAPDGKEELIGNCRLGKSIVPIE